MVQKNIYGVVSGYNNIGSLRVVMKKLLILKFSAAHSFGLVY